MVSQGRPELRVHAELDQTLLELKVRALGERNLFRATEGCGGTSESQSQHLLGSLSGLLGSSTSIFRLFRMVGVEDVTETALP